MVLSIMSHAFVKIRMSYLNAGIKHNHLEKPLLVALSFLKIVLIEEMFLGTVQPPGPKQTQLDSIMKQDT